MNLQDTVLIKCNSCGAINRVYKNKLSSGPKCGQCHSAINFPTKTVDVTASSFDTEVIQNPGIVLVDFWAPWCGHCRNLTPILDQIASEKAGIVKVVKINTQIEQDLAAKFDVRGIPALFLYQNGKRINQTAGYMPKNQLEEWITSSIH